MVQVQFYRCRYGKRHKWGKVQDFATLVDVVKDGCEREQRLRKGETLQWKLYSPKFFGPGRTC